ncbi:MAG: methyltransferase [Mycoplasmataceae bacterium]|jgi:release factor glutamine methyltransferase|nr:methyltransferase [Mycoplasmataceae bacterium]
MTFLQAVSKAKAKYHTNNHVVIFCILFKLSKKVKNKLAFVNLRNETIDFPFGLFDRSLKDYFQEQKPLGQIVNYTYFCHLKIRIFKNIFEPRAETELITESIIKYLNQHPNLRQGADLCCGTGCMGIAIKKYCPHVSMTSVDINPKAIDNTKFNAKLNNLKVTTINGDFYQSLITKKKKFDFIVCNPPYVSEEKLNPIMVKYENKISFTNSNDPLFFYKKLVNNKKQILKPNGKIFFENPNAQLLII